MMKKLMLLALMGLATLSFTACFDSTPEKSNNDDVASHDRVGDYAPITQADLDIFIQIMPEIAPYSRDEAGEDKILKKYGISRIRLNYLKGKIRYCDEAYQNDEEAFNLILPELRPSKEEIALVRSNWSAVMAAYGQYMSLAK